ncbi:MULTISPECIES: (Na+)-NQR maturation NqrM [unclassified Neisseria]|uniref:(Na+)-NQR maturation NqrM n=1 Tax=unclassified Neisseria TaxID=2623750 RepID=UPI001071CC29|nr:MULTISPECIES: (Na+)-NQR maturation NqrM [unclassified Neisseria]MBF0803052.1 (Na+)-NQR maturation NqrM [Neisseria sp. 19428wB4_WF04]TFU44343.1 (Na+)-NQR maturation NqrM [Neisseria sp. WF04]
MTIFFITFCFFLLVILGMALGYIFTRREIKGSCGGISALGMEKVCDCDTPCARRKAESAKQQKAAP